MFHVSCSYVKMFSYEKYSLFLLTGFFSGACVSDILVPTTSTKENLVAKIVSDFTLRFIQSHTPYISMVSAASTPEHDLLHKDIITEIIMLNNVTFTYRIIDYRIKFSRRRTFYLFLIESYKDFVLV